MAIAAKIKNGILSIEIFRGHEGALNHNAGDGGVSLKQKSGGQKPKCCKHTFWKMKKQFLWKKRLFICSAVVAFLCVFFGMEEWENHTPHSTGESMHTPRLRLPEASAAGRGEGDVKKDPYLMDEIVMPSWCYCVQLSGEGNSACQSSI